MQPGSEYIGLMRYLEGDKLCPYQDVAGVWTIGIGTTHIYGVAVSASTSCITDAQSVSFLMRDTGAEQALLNAHFPSKLNQNQNDATLSFIYNEGEGHFLSSTLYKKMLVDPNDSTIRNEFAKWVYVFDEKEQKMVVSSWQVQRRAKEANLYFTPVN